MFRRVWQRFVGLPRPALVILAATTVAAVTLLAVKAYEYYDYVEHDNDFCMGCHLMEDPYRRFVESGHRDLSCKACHKPSMIERSQMALTAVIENPDDIKSHAKVPNSKCAACHIDGDPEEWKVIANTPGHRVHFESDDPVLEGLQCVKCHSAAIHDFIPLDRTCGQAGCHVGLKVTLGKMAAANELHCVGCHNFLAQDRETTVAADLTPRQQDCMGCHDMQAVLASIDMTDEPHDANCATCHNPHEQTTPHDAEQTCAAAGCHSDLKSVSFHQGIDDSTLLQCVRCHEPHSWQPPSTACQDCHKLTSNGFVHAGRTTPSPPTWDFSHTRHAKVECRECHDSSESHGQLVVGKLECNKCHHDAQSPSVIAAGGECTTCHDLPIGGPLNVELTLNLTVWDAPRTRELPFGHAPHAEVPCRDCHSNSADMLDVPHCGTCHGEHHSRDNACWLCHSTDVQAAHTVAAHDGCQAAGCHANHVVWPVLEQNSTCLVCHADQRDHEPGGDCAECHGIPHGVGWSKVKG